MTRLAVIGSGIMGNGIAQIGAFGGYATRLQDISSEALAKARKTIEANLRKGIERGKYEEADMRRALGNLSYTTDLREAVGDADVVIEAVTENLELKRALFARLDELCPPRTLLATNTSALSITAIAAATKRPAQVIGMHFFNPPHIMRLIEIVRGLETSDESLRLAEEVSRRMGKETVAVNDKAGFITSRINAAIGNEAFRMLEEGVASARDIDKAVRLGLNFPMGPFELVDLVGLDTRLNALEFMHQHLGERYRPTPIHRTYVAAGRLGRKSGKGFFEYDANGNIIGE
ncbi:MAG: 3-hydroxyacyl-CoA dehydrogenase [Candidatus Tectomicrobia bacterium]|nr:3-hydroxyacyl-CoA dehydrogenase [Candidatus Tectomicrobia bacterium]